MGKERKEASQARLHAALHHSDAVEKLCESVGAKLIITNGGQHWRVKYRGEIISFWPSSGKVFHSRLKHFPSVKSAPDFGALINAYFGEIHGTVETRNTPAKVQIEGPMSAMRKEAVEELCHLLAML